MFSFLVLTKHHAPDELDYFACVKQPPLTELTHSKVTHMLKRKRKKEDVADDDERKKMRKKTPGFDKETVANIEKTVDNIEAVVEDRKMTRKKNNVEKSTVQQA